MSRHEELEHTGELRLRLWAPTREALFVEAARALGGVLAGQEGFEPGSEAQETVVVHARDIAGLLVEWLNELVFFAEQRGRVATSCVIERLDDGALTAHLRGERPRVWKTAVKAATYAGLTVTAVDGGFEANVVLDV